MGINWNEKYNPESLNFLRNQPNIALPTIFTDALSYYEQISKIYHALLEIVEKVNNSVDLSHEAVNTANEALAGVDVARLKADSKVCLYKGATELSTDITAVINLGVLATDELKNYFVVESDAAEVVPTVCIDYRNGYAGIAAIDEDTGEVKITPIGFGLDITNVVKVIEQSFSTEEKAQARVNIGAASQSDMSTAQGNISTLQEQYSTLDGAVVKHTAQTLSDAQKTQARANIGAANANDVSTLDGDAVKYVSQSKTDAEKTQARANIDAPSVAYVDAKPHVPAVASGDVGKVLTAGSGNYAWETPLAISGTADVLVCNISISGSSYVCDKTYAQIAQAVLSGWPVVGVIEFSDGKKQVGVLCVETNAFKFEANVGSKCYSATVANDNAVTVSVTDVTETFVVVGNFNSVANGEYSIVSPSAQEIQAALAAHKTLVITNANGTFRVYCTEYRTMECYAYTNNAMFTVTPYSVDIINTINLLDLDGNAMVASSGSVTAFGQSVSSAELEGYLSHFIDERENVYIRFEDASGYQHQLSAVGYSVFNNNYDWYIYFVDYTNQTTPRRITVSSTGSWTANSL